MPDYQTIETGFTDLRGMTLVARATGNPITIGTVNWYLKALTGVNADKWWRTSDDTWQVAETANAMTHQADGHWTIDPVNGATSPFDDGVLYLEYAKESGNLHIPVARHLKAGHTATITAAKKISGVVTTDVLTTYTGNTPQTGDGFAILADLTFGNAALATLINAVGAQTVAAAIRSAVGLAAADLGAQLATISAKTTNLPASPAATGAAMTLTPAERTATITEMFGTLIEVSGFTFQELLKILGAFASGRTVITVPAPNTLQIIFRNKANDKDRLTVTIDASNQRTAAVYDVTG